MYPCNINKPINFKTKSAAISRIFALRGHKSAAISRVVVLCAPKSAAIFPGCLCSVRLKVLQIPDHEKGDVPRQEDRRPLT